MLFFAAPAAAHVLLRAGAALLNARPAPARSGRGRPPVLSLWLASSCSRRRLAVSLFAPLTPLCVAAVAASLSAALPLARLRAEAFAEGMVGTRPPGPAALAAGVAAFASTLTYFDTGLTLPEHQVLSEPPPAWARALHSGSPSPRRGSRCGAVEAGPWSRGGGGGVRLRGLVPPCTRCSARSLRGGTGRGPDWRGFSVRLNAPALLVGNRPRPVRTCRSYFWRRPLRGPLFIEEGGWRGCAADAKRAAVAVGVKRAHACGVAALYTRGAGSRARLLTAGVRSISCWPTSRTAGPSVCPLFPSGGCASRRPGPFARASRL